MRIRPCSKNKPALQPVSAPYLRYTRVQDDFSRPITYRKLRYRTYSTEVTSINEQSPASTHTCVFAHAQIIYQRVQQKSRKIFVQNVEILPLFLCSFSIFLFYPLLSVLCFLCVPVPSFLLRGTTAYDRIISVKPGRQCRKEGGGLHRSA